MPSNTGNDVGMIARVALKIVFATITRLARAGKLTEDDINAIQGLAMDDIDQSEDGQKLMHHVKDNFDSVRSKIPAA